jgi:hypothetical protein
MAHKTHGRLSNGDVDVLNAGGPLLLDPGKEVEKTFGRLGRRLVSMFSARQPHKQCHRSTFSYFSGGERYVAVAPTIW